MLTKKKNKKTQIDNNCQHKVPYKVKITFKNQDKIKIFSAHKN